MSESLYEIATQYQEILMMDAASDDERAAMVAAIDEIGERFEDKAENVIKFIRNTESDAEALRAEEKRLAERRKHLENKVVNLTNYLEAMMVLAGKRDMKAGIFTAKFRANPPSILIIDEAAIPRIFFINQAPVLSKSAIKDAIKEGQTVPGVEVVRGERLEIK